MHVIDDDEAVRDSLALLLETEGLVAATYGSVEAFLASVGSTSGGCILADVHMEGMGGLEMMAELHARGVKPPVVLMTGRPSPELTARALRAGATAVVDKPFTSEALLDALRAAVASVS